MCSTSNPGWVAAFAIKGFIEVDCRKITLLDPASLSYWKVRLLKVAKPIVEEITEPVLTEDWIAVLVDLATQGSAADKKLLVDMIDKRVDDMKSEAGIPVSIIPDYWQSVLRTAPDADRAWEFACFKFDYLLKEALSIHREKGQARTCIGILRHLTSQQLDRRTILPRCRRDSGRGIW